MPAMPSTNAVYKRVTVANPGAGAEVVFVVPGNKDWFLYAVYVQLVQGITQTPQPIILMDDGTNTWMESIGSSAVQAVSTTCAYSWAPNMLLTGQVGSGVNVHSNAPIPDSLVLPAGYRIRTNTVGIGANSQYQNASCMIAELG